MGVGALTHGDVADGRSHQNAFRAFERAEHDLDGKLAAVFAPPDELDSSADLLGQSFGCAASTVGDDALREALGNDVLHLLPDEFIAAVPELLFRPDVQQDNLSGHVHHHHGVGGGFEQPAVPAFHLRQMGFRTLARTDVADGRGHQNPFLTFQRAQHNLDGKLATVFAPPDEFNSGADLLRKSFGRAARSVGDDAFREALGNDVLHFLAYQFVAAVAKLLFCLNVQQNNLSAHVYHHHGIGRRFQQPAVGLELYLPVRSGRGLHFT